MATNRKPKAVEPTPEPANDAKINFEIRTSDGAVFKGRGGLYPNEVVFGIYMLICGWGNGKPVGNGKSKIAFENAARAYRKAAREFYETVK